MSTKLKDAFLPNRAVDGTTSIVLVVFWLAAGVLIWLRSPFASLPTLPDVWRALGGLWWKEGLGPEIFTTLRLIAQATLLTVVLSLTLSYLTVLAFFRPLIEAISKLRFLGLTGLVFPFTLLTGGGYSLKVALLTFGMLTFFVTSMAQVIVEIPQREFDHMRVLGASEFRILWEVVVRGTLDKALDILRQNVAMGWSMITMVEGISRSDGGVGAMILNQNKYLRLDQVYAILIVILIIGLGIDYAMGLLIRALCPHVALGRVRR